MPAEYIAIPITLGRWGHNPRPGFSVRCPSTDGWKTRAARLLQDGLRAKWSSRRGYAISAAKFAKFERLYAEGWDASVMTGKLVSPKPERIAT